MLNSESKAFIKESFKEDSTQDNIHFLSQKFDTSTRSIIAVLTAAGLYKKPGYLTKTGEKPIPKQEIVDLIAKAMKVSPDLLEGLEKTNKSVLRLLLRALDKSSDEYFRP
jgi:hypothetical protein